jgi:16S rRNA (guanine527-N7)-methyltransferase
MKFGPEEFAAKTNVSRETLRDLMAYVDLLARWQRRINLVSGKTLPDLWQRHMMDSAQLVPLVLNPNGAWLDFGSGAGFPGLVVAIMLKGTPDFHMHLIESNGKKASFLREAARLTESPVTVHSERMEAVEPFPITVLSARAVAPLIDLLTYAEPYFAFKPEMFFPKGQDVDEELTTASKYWNIDLDKYPSMTDSNGVILKIKEVHRV